MTDLDQFAAAALKGLLANPNFDELDDTDLATRAYEIASAMTEKRDHWNGIVAPTLTAEEREGIEHACDMYEEWKDYGATKHDAVLRWAAALRNLLDRMR
jgi:hypothetical protein